MTTILKQLWKNEYVQTAVVIGLIALAVFGFWYGSKVILNTQYPTLAVVSGSMCVPYNGSCDGWSHPFDQTLHIGDVIIVQGINPADLNVGYPYSDIIVFKDPRDSTDPDLIVHRIVSKQEVNGTLYFRTKGDGNSNKKWPTALSELSDSDYDPWAIPPSLGISEDKVVGKVVMRIPWLGRLVLFINPKYNPWGLPIIIALIILLVVVEFILPLLREKKPSEQPKKV